MKKHSLLLTAAAFVLAGVFAVFELADSPRFRHDSAATIVFSDVRSFEMPEETTAPGFTVNINTAGLEELMTLEEIGEKRARAIIEYREANGRFISVDELAGVSGIGSRTVEINRARLTV